MERIQRPVATALKVNFWAYFISMAITFVGFYGFTYLITWLMINETKTPQLLGNVLAATMVPAIFLNVVAQRLLTRVSARLMMVVTDLLTGLLLVGVAWLMAVPKWHIQLLIVASVLNKTIGVFYKLSNKTILPQIFPAAKIQQVNGIQTQVRQVAIVSSSMVIAGLLLWMQPRGIILVMGIGFLISVFFDLRLTFLEPTVGQKKAGASVAWKNLIKQAGLAALVGYAMIGSLIDASIAVLVPWLTVTRFQSNFILSLLMTVEALGIISGPLWLKRFPTVKLRTLSALTMGSLLIFLPNIALLVVGMLIVGSLRGAFNVRLFSKLQMETPSHVLNQTMALVLTMMDTATVVGTLLVPRLTRIWHEGTLSYIGLSLLLISGSIAVWWWRYTAAKR